MNWHVSVKLQGIKMQVERLVTVSKGTCWPPTCVRTCSKPQCQIFTQILGTSKIPYKMHTGDICKLMCLTRVQINGFVYDWPTLAFFNVLSTV